jgi:hypothetical protein
LLRDKPDTHVLFYQGRRGLNLNQCIVAAKDIDAKYLEPYCDCPDRGATGLGYAHMRWMVQQIDSGMSQDKAMRWLGYIQGVLVATGEVSLDEMKEANVRAVAV